MPAILVAFLSYTIQFLISPPSLTYLVPRTTGQEILALPSLGGLAAGGAFHHGSGIEKKRQHLTLSVSIGGLTIFS